MFRFFKRKKAKEENQASQEAEVAQAHEQEEPAASEAIVPEEPVTTSTATVPAESVEESAVAIAPVETVAPTVESSATPAPLEPQPEVIVTEVEAEAEASSPAPVADAEVAPSPVVTEVAPAKSSWMQRLRQGLSRTGSSIGSLFVGVKVDEDLFEELEMALLMADAGIEATESLLAKLRTKVKQQRIEDAAEVKEALKALLSEHLKPLEKDFMLPLDGTSVVMIAGVNGAGKTTSIGKLAHHFQAAGASVLLAAGILSEQRHGSNWSNGVSAIRWR